VFFSVAAVSAGCMSFPMPKMHIVLMVDFETNLGFPVISVSPFLHLC